MPEYRVYIVQWSLKFDPEDRQTTRDVQAAKMAIKRWCHAAQYGRRFIGFVVVSEESAIELAARLATETAPLGNIDNLHVFGAPQPDDIACANAGTFGPLNHWVRAGWVEARERNKPQNVRRFQRR